MLEDEKKVQRAKKNYFKPTTVPGVKAKPPIKKAKKGQPAGEKEGRTRKRAGARNEGAIGVLWIALRQRRGGKKVGKQRGSHGYYLQKKKGCLEGENNKTNGGWISRIKREINRAANCPSRGKAEERWYRGSRAPRNHLPVLEKI